MKAFEKSKDHLSDKVFYQSIALSFLGILLCIVILCSATWAWFQADVSSSNNSIQSAECNVSVEVTEGGVPVTASGGIYSLSKDVPYEFKLTASGTAGSSYCILRIGGEDYYTAQIPTTSPDNSITFTLQFSAQITDVEVITRWGISSRSERAFEDGGAYRDPTSAHASEEG